MALQPGNPAVNRVLLVEGDASVRGELERRIQDAGCGPVKAVKTAEAALRLLSSTEYDILVIALSSPEESGLAVIRQATGEARHTIVAVISGGEPNQHSGFEAGRLGAEKMFEKPLNYPQVLIWVRGALKILDAATSVKARAFDETLKENACTSALSLSQLAEENGRTLGHMTRLFNETFEMTVIQRRTHHRVEHAKKLLSETDLSLSEIAEQCGYLHLGSLDRVFSGLTGTTLKKYRAGFG